jgi:hypothetical protein
MLRRGWLVLIGIVVVPVRSFGFILSVDCDDTVQYFFVDIMWWAEDLLWSCQYPRVKLYRSVNAFALTVIFFMLLLVVSVSYNLILSSSRWVQLCLVFIFFVLVLCSCIFSYICTDAPLDVFSCIKGSFFVCLIGLGGNFFFWFHSHLLIMHFWLPSICIMLL